MHHSFGGGFVDFRCVNGAGLTLKTEWDLSRPQRCLALTVVVVCLLSPATWGINPATHISQYGHSSWRIQDGYFNGRLSAIAQTSDGYLWIGTETGLLRFDGVRFVPWNPPTGQQLPSPSIRSLLADADGSLWIGTNSGLSHWSNHNLSNLDIHGSIGDIVQDKDHSVWFVYAVSRRSSLCHIVQGATQCYGEKDGVSEAEGSMIQDSVGNIWLGTQHGVIRWRTGSFTAYSVRALQSLEGVDGVEAVAMSPEGSIIAATAMPGNGLGLEQLTEGIWMPYEKPGLSGTKVTSSTLLVDRESALWIGTLQEGLFRVYGDHVEHFGSNDGLSGDFVRSLYEDREGNLWVATSKGIDLFRNLRVVTFSSEESLGTQEVDSILASSDGTVWVGGAESLDAIRGGGISSVRSGKGLPGGQVGILFEDHAGQLWVGVDQKLFLYKNGKFKPISRDDGGPIGMVGTIAEDRDNNIWVTAWHESAVRLLRIRDFKIQEEFVHSSKIPPGRLLITDSHGSLWMAPSGGGLARVANAGAETFRFEVSGDPHVEQLILASDGSILGATASGVIAWKDNKRQVLSVGNGLPCDTVHGLINDAAGNLWLNLQCGLVEVGAADLKKWWDKSDTVVHPRLFDVFDGARPGNAPWRSAARSTDGRLWFANGAVLQMIDPAHIAVNEVPPPVHVERVVADRKSYTPQNGVAVPALTRDLEIDYTALSFAVPQKVFFRYKLEGRDADWIDALTRRQAFYSDLRPGGYRFRVMACNNDGVWNEAGASLEFSVLPAFYQTTWFRVLCVAAFMGLVWAIYQLRVQQLQRQFAIRLGERTRIARELHDTILQNFQGSLFQMQAARNLFSRQSEKGMQTLDNAIEEAQGAINEGRDAIQGLRSTPVAKGNLAELLVSTSREFTDFKLSEHPPVFNLIEEGERQALSSTVSNDICRIAFEVMRNAYRHAHAQRIEAEIRYDHSMFRLRIRDDGKGIDPKVLNEGGRTGHWGLRGIRERAQRIGARLDLWSEPGSGTEVQLLVPASSAYEGLQESFRAKLIRKVKSRAQRSESNPNPLSR